jgi:acetylornithine deacetylase/succinyl-diaminopimelate desuccinylase-like protein
VYAGPSVYVPFIRRPLPASQSPNAIVRAAEVVRALEEWGAQYQERHKYESARGVCIPKVNIGALRSGYPFRIISTPELCSLYLCVMMPPGMLPGTVEHELRAVATGLEQEIGIQLTSWRPGREVTPAADPLIAAIQSGHKSVRGGVPAAPRAEHSSMWRDMNVFNLYGIPSVCYGPGVSVAEGMYIEAADLADAARVYALTALNLIGETD